MKTKEQIKAEESLLKALKPKNTKIVKKKLKK